MDVIGQLHVQTALATGKEIGGWVGITDDPDAVFKVYLNKWKTMMCIISAITCHIMRQMVMLAVADKFPLSKFNKFI